MSGPWTCALCEATSAGTQVKRSKRDLGICTWCEGELTRLGLERCRKCSRRCRPDEIHRGRPHWCRACHAARWQAYYAQHRDEVRAKRQTYYHANKDKYHRETPEQKRARQRASYARHRERVLLRVRAWREAHAEQERARKRAVYHARMAQNPSYRRMLRQQTKIRMFRRLLKGAA